jgi:hypothetical protein
MQKERRRRAPKDGDKDKDAGAKGPRAAKGRSSDPVTIDFHGPVPSEDCFAPPPRSAKATMVTDVSLRRAALDGPSVYLIPDDQAVPGEGEGEEEGGGEGRRAHGGPRGSIESDGLGAGEDSDGHGDGGHGFDYGGPDHDGDGDGDLGQGDRTWGDTTLVQLPHTVQAGEIHYARVAKTVSRGRAPRVGG